MSTTKGGIEHKIYVKILNWPNSVALMCFYLRLAIVCVLKFISIDYQLIRYHLIRKIKVKREKNNRTKNPEEQKNEKYKKFKEQKKSDKRKIRRTKS